MAKLLYFQWHSFMNRGIERALQKLNIEYDTFFYQFTDWEQDDNFCENLEEKLQSGNYDRVLSVNFAPLISEVCKRHNTSYLSWVYDSPLHIRNLEPLKNSCNTIYFFDRVQAQQFREMGVDARHLPLAVDTDAFRVNPSRAEREKHSSDISLVGNLYQTEYRYYMQPLSKYQQGYLEGIIQAQLKLYGGYLIPEIITDELIRELNNSYRNAGRDQMTVGRRELEFLLACETTGRERYLALALLSGHFETAIYSTQQDERLQQVKFKGYADYYKVMPIVFQNSRINLNITLKTIQTGIPLRVIDIMGCGGFVLTNYQEEIAECFENGTECIMYESLEDMYAKAKFYLEHDSERRRIAENGFEKIKRNFTFEERLKEMLG